MMQLACDKLTKLLRVDILLSLEYNLKKLKVFIKWPDYAE